MIEETDSWMIHDRKHLSEPQLDHIVGLELLGAWPIKCAYAVQEIFQTEGDYILSLMDVLNGYRTPLLFHLREDNQCHRIIHTIFGNLDAIYDLHQYLIDKLKLQQGDPYEFGQVFVATEEKFKIYARYCTNYDGAMTCLQQLTTSDKDFEHFLSECQGKLGHLLPLSSQLIKPVQRIMRYHIMLKEVVKHFDCNFHGYHSLYAAHQTMLQIGDYINNVQKKKENAERSMDLQCNTYGLSDKDVKNLTTYGDLIIEDSCKVGFKSIQRQVVLFDKLLLILKKKDAKKYTYKGHVLASELQIDLKFCRANPNMLKVSSRFHHHHSYEIDLGSARKQQQWLNKIHGLIQTVMEQSNRSRVLKEKQSSQSHKVKRQKLESVDVIDGIAIPIPEQRKRSSSLFAQHSKVGGGRLYKKRNRNDIRSLFPEKETGSAAKRPSHAMPSSDTTKSLPEFGTANPPNNVQHQEHVSLEPESSRVVQNILEHKSASMDSLGDVENVGTMEEEVGGIDSSRSQASSKLVRRTAIKVKKSKSITSGLCLSASSSLVLFAGREVNETTSLPLLDGAATGMMESGPGLSDTSDVAVYTLSSLDTSSSLYGTGHDYSIAPDSGSNRRMPNGADLETTPTINEMGGDVDLSKDEGEIKIDKHLLTRTLSFRRPRRTSHDNSHPEDDLGKQVAILVNSDVLELGHSCEKSSLRGGEGMLKEMVRDGRESEDWVDQAGRDGAGGRSMDLSETDGPDASEVTEEEDMMIYEDSSDSEEEEEDLEKTANELESSLLEVVAMEEAVLELDKDTSGSSTQLSLSPDQVVPQQDLNGDSNLQDTNGICSDSSTPQSSKATSLTDFELKHSTNTKSSIDTYFTLPHKKKPSSSSSLICPPSTEQQSPYRTGGELSQSSIRRMEGFSRLLEFTRQQVCLDPENGYKDENCENPSVLDFSQSLPVLSHFVLDDVTDDNEMDTDWSLAAGTENSVKNAAGTENSVENVAGTVHSIESFTETENSVDMFAENSINTAAGTKNSVENAAGTENSIDSSSETENSIDLSVENSINLAAETGNSIDTAAETCNSIDTAAVTAYLIETAAENDNSIDTAADTDNSIDTAAETGYSIDTTAETGNFIDTAAETGNSIDTAAETDNSIDTAAETDNSIDTAAETGYSIDTTAETGNFIDTAAETGNSIDTAAETGNSIDTAAETGNFIETAAETGNSIDTAAETGNSIDTTSETGNSVDTAAKTGNSIDTAAETGNSIDTAAETGNSIDTAAKTGNSIDTAEEQLDYLNGDHVEAEEIEQENHDIAIEVEIVEKNLWAEDGNGVELEEGDIELNAVTDVISENETVGIARREVDGEIGVFAYWSRAFRFRVRSILPYTNSIVVIGIAVAVGMFYIYFW